MLRVTNIVPVFLEIGFTQTESEISSPSNLNKAESSIWTDCAGFDDKAEFVTCNARVVPVPPSTN